jgi:hypothetical protein
MDYTKILPRLPALFQNRGRAHHKALPFESYADLPALNASVLKCRTPLDMLHAMQDPEDRPAKECFDLGGNLHCALLEPDRWEKSLYVYDGETPTKREMERWSSPLIALPEDAPKRPSKAQVNAAKPSPKTLEAISWWDAFNAKVDGATVVTEEEHQRAAEWHHFQATTKGKTILSSTDHDQVLEMRKALLRHHEIRRLMEAPGTNETTVEVWDPEWEVMRKARFDRLPGKIVSGGRAYPSFVVDIKTTSANIDSDWAIRNEILKWGYHLQARWYLDILGMALDEPPRDRFYFAFVTIKPPYKSRLYELNINTEGDNLLNDAGEILYQRGEHTVGRVPMFVAAAREFLIRIEERHPDPLGAWHAYEHEGARIVEACLTR